MLVVGPLLLLTVVMGFGFSIFISALWPSVPMVVPQNAVGKAFGLMSCIQDIWNALAPLIVALLYNRTGQRYF